MLISLQHLQVEAGILFDLLQTPAPKFPHLTDCWITSLRNFCTEFDIAIRCQHNWVPTPARIHDTCLMDQALLLNLTRQEWTSTSSERTYRWPPSAISSLRTGILSSGLAGTAIAFLTIAVQLSLRVSFNPPHISEAFGAVSCGVSLSWAPKLPISFYRLPSEHGQVHPLWRGAQWCGCKLSTEEILMSTAETATWLFITLNNWSTLWVARLRLARFTIPSLTGTLPPFLG